VDDDAAGGTQDVTLLTAAERRTVVLVGAVPVVLVLVVLVVLVALGRATLVDLVLGTVVYGVAHERASAGHCPRCGAAGARRATSCGSCDYDLARRPVWVCEERHERAREPGLCSCGRRLVEREPAPGLGSSIRRTLWVGLWFFCLLVGTAVLLRIAG
jgi:hypothetical protein